MLKQQTTSCHSGAVLSIPHIHSDNTDNFLPQWCCVVSSPHPFRQHRQCFATVVLCCQFSTCIQTTQTSCHTCCVVLSVPHMHSDNTDFMPQMLCCLVSSPHAFRQHRQLGVTVVLKANSVKIIGFSIWGFATHVQCNNNCYNACYRQLELPIVTLVWLTVMLQWQF